MTTYAEALQLILDTVRAMPVEEKPLTRGLGQVLAEDVHADFDLPRQATGGPDGYAVRLEDIATAGPQCPVTLRVIGTARAGQVSRRAAAPGTAIRTMTGSVLPEGADCVIRFEDTDEPGDKNGPNPAHPKTVKIFVPAPQGPPSVSRPGALITRGALAVARGTVIGPSQISVLTQLGCLRVRVHRRPVIGILSSGDELVAPGRPLKPGQIHDCNSGAMAAFVRHLGGIPRPLGIARDREASLVSKLTQGLRLDAILSTGGVSKGDYDLTRKVLGRLGEVRFARIAMGPGAAVTFGVLRDGLREVPLFALSGPPTGCLINVETLVRPALLRMLGRQDVAHRVVTALAEDASPDRKGFAFVKWSALRKDGDTWRVRLSAGGPGMLPGLGAGNALTIIPGQTSIAPGDAIEVLPLDWCHP